MAKALWVEGGDIVVQEAVVFPLTFPWQFCKENNILSQNVHFLLFYIFIL